MKTAIALLFLIAACTSLSQLQSDNHFASTQKTIKLNPQQRLTLSLDVAGRNSDGMPGTFALQTSLLQIRWNGVLIDEWRPQDYEIHSYSIKVKPRPGLNTLQFSVTDKITGAVTFTNVSLKRRNQNQELLVNGDFNSVDLGTWYKAYNIQNTVKGWQTLNGYALGPKGFFNKRFKTNHATLDKNNPSIYQTFRFEIEEKDE